MRLLRHVHLFVGALKTFLFEAITARNGGDVRLQNPVKVRMALLGKFTNYFCPFTSSKCFFYCPQVAILVKCEIRFGTCPL